jgi:hypothetical protein
MTIRTEIPLAIGAVFYVLAALTIYGLMIGVTFKGHQPHPEGTQASDNRVALRLVPLAVLWPALLPTVVLFKLFPGLHRWAETGKFGRPEAA